VEIRWWNVAANKEERVTLPAQRFEARAGAAYQAPFSVEQDLRDMGRQVQVRIPGGWLALAAGVALAAVAWWLGAPWLRRTLARLRAGLRARREQWQASEPYGCAELAAQPRSRRGRPAWTRRCANPQTMRCEPAMAGSRTRRAAGANCAGCSRVGAEPCAHRYERAARKTCLR
jgi:hypothetical protein